MMLSLLRTCKFYTCLISRISILVVPCFVHSQLLAMYAECACIQYAVSVCSHGILSQIEMPDEDGELDDYMVLKITGVFVVFMCF